jgi:integrase
VISATPPKRGLKNLVRKEASKAGARTWTLVHGDLAVSSFSTFCERNAGYAYATQKRYAEAVSLFLDYLFEGGVFDDPVTSSYLNSLIDAYPALLRDGSETLAARIESSVGSSEQHLRLAKVARALGWRPMAPHSFANTLAAVNRFLRLSEMLAREAYEKAQALGLPTSGLGLIKALEGTTVLSRHEVAAMRQNSMLGSVAKFNPNGIQRARRLTAPRTQAQISRDLDFPLEWLPALIENAGSWRDRALWLLLAAAGLRISEAKNLLIEDIDLAAQEVFVLNPASRRFPVPAADARIHRFKGRAMAVTYLFPPLRQQFFSALEQYLRHEFVPAYKPGEPPYLFQYVEPKYRGRPLADASDSANAQNFKRAVRRAKVPLPHGAPEWTPHSLRHLYGVYMVNDYPVNPALGKFGLELVEVQMLMGHKSIRSTEHYARSKLRRLAAKLRAVDEEMLGLTTEELGRLPLSVLNRLGVART